MQPLVEIIHEGETAGGWTFRVQLLNEAGACVPLQLQLSWQDYDLFCPDGAVPPEGVAKAVALVAAELWPEGLPARLDAAALRRRDHTADERITQRVDLSAM